MSTSAIELSTQLYVPLSQSESELRISTFDDRIFWNTSVFLGNSLERNAFQLSWDKHRGMSVCAQKFRWWIPSLFSTRTELHTIKLSVGVTPRSLHPQPLNGLHPHRRPIHSVPPYIVWCICIDQRSSRRETKRSIRIRHHQIINDLHFGGYVFFPFPVIISSIFEPFGHEDSIEYITKSFPISLYMHTFCSPSNSFCQHVLLPVFPSPIPSVQGSAASFLFSSQAPISSPHSQESRKSTLNTHSRVNLIQIAWNQIGYHNTYGVKGTLTWSLVKQTLRLKEHTYSTPDPPTRIDSKSPTRRDIYSVPYLAYQLSRM